MAGSIASPLGGLRAGRAPFAGAIPIFLVTGFLGVGKTTLVRHLLASPGGRRSAVIVNEFAELGLDHSLLGGEGSQIEMLPNGCFCCRGRGDLAATLLALFEGRRSGSVPTSIESSSKPAASRTPGRFCSP